jgi:hypothetical protein
MTQREVAERLEWSLSKLMRIEAASVGISVTDLRAMLELYRVTDEHLVRSLTDAARGSKGQSWFSPYRDVISPQFAQYLGHEGSASSIRVFHPFLIPGLLHTRGYADELLRAHLGTEETRRIVDLRMKRQQNLLSRTQPANMAFLVDEGALLRLIGGPAVMQRQLRHLLDISTRPGVSVQIVPFSSGAHPGLLGPFVLLSLGNCAEDLLYVESASGDLLSRDDQEKIIQFTEYFETVRGLALPDDQARTLMQGLISQLDQKEENGSREPGGAQEPQSLVGLNPPELLSGLTDLGEVRWECSGTGVKSLPAHVPIVQIRSSACSTSFPAIRTGHAVLSRSSVALSLSAVLASRL